MHGIILGSKNPPNGAGRKIAFLQQKVLCRVKMRLNDENIRAAKK